MINANITNHTTVHNGTFSINIVFDTNITDFTKSDITFQAVSGNGITDLTFSEITGTGTSYMLTGTVPSGIAGAFSVEISGEVNASGQAQTVHTTPRIFNYDTIPNVTTTMKQVDHHENGEVTLQVEFSTEVIWFDKTDLRLQWIAGHDLSLMDYYITGSGRTYRIYFQPSNDTQGGMLVDIRGSVQRPSGLIREIINITPILITYKCQ